MIHLAPSGASKCDYGVSVAPAQCESAVRSFAEKEGKIVNQSMRVGLGGTCLDGSWGQVPLGCSAQSGGAWVAHYKMPMYIGDGCIHAQYQLVCVSTGTIYFYHLLKLSLLY